jgi:hypothetical protein
MALGLKESIFRMGEFEFSVVVGLNFSKFKDYGETFAEKIF